MLIDLTHPLLDGQPGFPGDPALEVRQHDTIPSTGYNVARISMSSHQGTHLDAPFHFHEGGRTVDELELERFFGEASLIDFAPGGELPAGTALTREMFEARGNVFVEGARVLYRTGWSSRFGTEEYFRGFPSITDEAARWIASRRIGLLGMDTPSPAEDWAESHRVLLAEGTEIVIVEGLANLEQLPPRFVFVGLPLKWKGGDGSPIRAAAVI